MPYIDIGVNLTNKSLISDLSAVLDRAREAKVKSLIVTGTSIDESRQALSLCESHDYPFYCTAGVHPHHASDWDDECKNTILTLAENPAVRAIGETGLDFNRNFSAENEQLIAFEEQLKIACESRKPVFLHQRDAHGAFIELLTQYRPALSRVVVHCFTDSESALRDYLDLDCYIGITGWICDERRGLELQKSVAIIPHNRIMLETDAPYLLPRNLDFKPRNRINEPAYLPYIAETVAKCRSQSVEELSKHCFNNSIKFFELNDIGEF